MKVWWLFEVMLCIFYWDVCEVNVCGMVCDVLNVLSMMC